MCIERAIYGKAEDFCLPPSAFRHLVKLQFVTHCGILAGPRWEESESRQPLRAVVGNPHAGDLLKRTVWLCGVPHQLRGVPVDLVEIGAIWRNPAIARSAADI